VKFGRKTTPGLRYGARAIAVFVGLLGPVMLGASFAHALSEIDPDHFDPPNTEPIPQPRTADSKVTGTRYDRTFSLPYSVLCTGNNLAPGKYSISLRSDSKLGQATLNQKGHAVEIAGVVQTETSKQRDEVVVVENNKNGRTLSVVRVRGLDFVFDLKHCSDPSPDHRLTRAEKLPLSVIAPMKSQTKSPGKRRLGHDGVRGQI